jgi:peptidoglycan/LPS O-acetylase OafA/YrhL
MSERQNSLGVYRRDIDGLRGIAVLSVVIYHAFPKFIKAGFIGVDVFFVISGYLISDIILREDSDGLFRYSEFYARRARRIFPALILVLLASLAVGWFVLWSAEYKSLGKAVAAGAGFIANLLLYSEAGYFDLASHEKPLLHLWSLGVEEQFYFVWPTLLLLANQYRFLWLPALLGLASFVLCVMVTGAHQDAAFYLPVYRFWEFMVGFLVCWLSRHGRFIRLRGLQASRGKLAISVGVVRSVSGLFLLIISYVIIDQRKPFPGFLAVLPVMAAGFLVASGEKAFVNKWLLSMRWLVYIGLISYPLYLWHWPLISFEYLMDSGDRTRVVSFGLLALGLLLADLTWRFVERPVRKARSGRLSVALFLGLALVGAVGGIVSLSDGLPARLNEIAEDLQKSKQLGWSLSGWVSSCPDRILNANGAEVACKRLPGNPGESRRILLVGDSHAMAFAEALNQVKDDTGMGFSAHIMAKGGCMPFGWVEKLHGSNECHPFYSSIYEYATDDDVADAVILVGRWAARFHGTGFGVDTLPHAFRDVRKMQGESQESLFARTLRETLQQLYATGKRIIFVHQVPELGFNTKSCLPRPFSFKPVNVCMIDRVMVEARQSGYRSVVRSVMSAFPGILELDPLDSFCDRQYCYARIDGDYLYTDNNHLSDVGARRLGPALARLIK